MSEKPITRERLLRVLDSQAAKTAHAISGLSQEALNQVARDDGWTAKEILAHMASAYEGMLALAQGGVPGGFAQEGFDLDEYNESQRRLATAMSPAVALTWLEQARQKVRSYIEEVNEADYTEVVQTPWMGDHLRGQFLMFPALHEGGHRVELERWRARAEAQQG